MYVLGGGDERRELMYPPQFGGHVQPTALLHSVAGLTGHHVLTVAGFSKNKVNFVDYYSPIVNIKWRTRRRRS